MENRTQLLPLIRKHSCYWISPRVANKDTDKDSSKNTSGDTNKAKME